MDMDMVEKKKVERCEGWGDGGMDGWMAEII